MHRHNILIAWTSFMLAFCNKFKPNGYCWLVVRSRTKRTNWFHIEVHGTLYVCHVNDERTACHVCVLVRIPQIFDDRMNYSIRLQILQKQNRWANSCVATDSGYSPRTESNMASLMLWKQLTPMSRALFSLYLSVYDLKWQKVNRRFGNVMTVYVCCAVLCTDTWIHSSYRMCAIVRKSTKYSRIIRGVREFGDDANQSV